MFSGQPSGSGQILWNPISKTQSFAFRLSVHIMRLQQIWSHLFLEGAPSSNCSFTSKKPLSGTHAADALHYAVSPHLVQIEAALHCSLVAERGAEGLVGSESGKVVKRKWGYPSHDSNIVYMVDIIRGIFYMWWIYWGNIVGIEYNQDMVPSNV